jgi:hypothetical protein
MQKACGEWTMGCHAFHQRLPPWQGAHPASRRIHTTISRRAQCHSTLSGAGGPWTAGSSLPLSAVPTSSAPTGMRKTIAQGTALGLINIFSSVARRVSGAVKISENSSVLVRDGRLNGAARPHAHPCPTISPPNSPTPTSLHFLSERLFRDWSCD